MTNTAEAAPSAEDTIAQAIQQALVCQRLGERQRAEELYRAILQARPDEPTANHNFGVLLVQADQAVASLPHFEAALAADATVAQYWLSYIEALALSGKANDAREILNLAKEHGLSGTEVDKLTAELAASLPPSAAQSQDIPGIDQTIHRQSTKKSSGPSSGRSGKQTSQAKVEALIALFNQGRFAEGEALAAEMTRRFPKQGMGWKLLGAIQLGMGRAAEALEPTRKAAALLPRDAEVHSNLGIVFAALKRWQDAEAAYARALKISPNFAMAHFNLGLSLQAQDKLAEAEASYRRAVGFKADLPDAHFNLAVLLQARSDYRGAENSYLLALRYKPKWAEAHNNLGSAQKDQGRYADAEFSYQNALAIRPDYADALSNLGIVLRLQHRASEAEECYRRALTIDPNSMEAAYNLGISLGEQGRWVEAEHCYRRALELKPDYFQAHNNLGTVLGKQCRFSEAEASHRRTLELNPNYPEAHCNLGSALKEQGRLAEAEDCYRRALQLKADMVEAYYNLGIVAADQSRFAESEASYRKGLAINPRHIETYRNLGVVLKEQGRFDEAGACYRQALAINPDYAEVLGNLLFDMNYAAHSDPADCVAQAREYGRLLEKRAGRAHTRWRCSQQPERLRVGMVTADLKTHPVGMLLENVLTQIDPVRIELIAYPTHHAEDKLTARIRPRFAKWTRLVGHSDAAAAQIIHADGVHVLFDLSGHTAGNRLPVFAFKPAPVQVTWLGYFATTGVAQMDYVLADPHVAPQSEEDHFTERVWRLPESYMCFTPPEYALQVNTLPALAGSGMTFGCFNNLAKMTDEAVALWSRVLHAVLGSRLLLKTKQLNDAAICARTLARFAVHGIDGSQLMLEGSSPREKLLATYQRVDVGLDPFPYPGGTTSIESLWMGVPVITRKGDRFVSHVGEGIAYNAGLEGWIAANDDGYVAKAVAAAADLQRLALLRAGLRQQVLASPLFDAQRFAHHLENALWDMWRRFATQQGI